MPSNKPRVAAYLSENLRERFDQFKVERNIKGDSQTLIAILSEFLGVSQEVTYQGNSNTIQALEDRLAQIKDELLSELRSELLKFETVTNEKIGALEAGLTSAQQVKVEVRDELLNELKSKLSTDFEPTRRDEAPGQLKLIPEKVEHVELSEVANPLVKEEQVEVEQRIKLSAAKLCKRLGVGSSTMSARKGDSPKRFAEWSRSKDPDGVAWAFMSQSSCFHPVSELQGDVLNELLISFCDESSNTLTTGNLAKRLRVASSTLSHKKADKSPQELTEWIRKKDPEGIGWTFLAESNCYKPEQSVSSEPPTALQSELPVSIEDEPDSETYSFQSPPLS